MTKIERRDPMYTTGTLHQGKQVHIIEVGSDYNASILCKDPESRFFSPGAKEYPINNKTVDCTKCLKRYYEITEEK